MNRDRTAFPPRRFKPVAHHAEFEGLYQPDGFHPVRFNERFHHRYVVFRKLGWATQSTVWLASDQQTGRYVALKVLMSKHSNGASMEETFAPDPELKAHPGAKHVCVKLDSFTFEGPNGRHRCFVFEPLGRSFQEVLDGAARSARDPEYSPRPYGTKRWTIRFAREACRQLVLGLDYLHSQRIMHRDIQPGNILLSLTYDLDALTKDKIQLDVWDDEDAEGDQDTMSESAWAEMNLRRQLDYMNMIERSDGEELTAHDPLYTVAGISLHDKLKVGSCVLGDLLIKLIDLGSACKFEDCNDGAAPYPLDLRAPEVVLKQPCDEKADIWALACTMFRIMNLEPLVPLWVTLDKDATDDENMINLIDRFGKLPDHLRRQWARADEYLDADGSILNPEPCKPDSAQFGDLWQGVRLAKPNDMSEAESMVFFDLLKKMLDYDPARRLSTKEVLNHRWFQVEEFE